MAMCQAPLFLLSVLMMTTSPTLGLTLASLWVKLGCSRRADRYSLFHRYQRLSLQVFKWWVRFWILSPIMLQVLEHDWRGGRLRGLCNWFSESLGFSQTAPLTEHPSCLNKQTVQVLISIAEERAMIFLREGHLSSVGQHRSVDVRMVAAHLVKFSPLNKVFVVQARLSLQWVKCSSVSSYKSALRLGSLCEWLQMLIHL